MGSVASSGNPAVKGLGSRFTLAEEIMDPQRRATTLLLGIESAPGAATTAAALHLRQLGAAVHFPSEALSRIYASAEAQAVLLPMFGPDIVGPSGLDPVRLDKLLRGLSADDQARALTEFHAAIDPLLDSDRTKFMEQLSTGRHWLAVLVVPLLFESRLHELMDATMVLSAPGQAQEVQLPEMPRVRPHLLYLTDAQECKGRADWDIDTSLGMPALRAQLAAAVQGMASTHAVMKFKRWSMLNDHAPKAVVFELETSLWPKPVEAERAASLQLCSELQNQLDVTVTLEQLQAVLQSPALVNKLRWATHDQEATRRAAVEAVVAHYIVDHKLHAQIVSSSLRQFDVAMEAALKDESTEAQALDVVRQLKESGFSVGVIARTEAGASGTGQLSHHVDFWVSSNGCGGQTPALAPLLQAAQLQECRLGQLVYVGSASDVGCATRHGAHGVMIGNGNLMSGMSSFAQTREIVVVSTLSSVPRELAKRYRPLASIPLDAARAEGSDPTVHQVEST